MKENFNPQEYRDNLSEEIKQEPDEEKRWEILEQARDTEEYKLARKTKIKAFLDRSKENLESEKSAAESIFPLTFNAINKGYPQYLERLKTVRYAKIDDMAFVGARDKAAYENIEHAILFERKFIDELTEQSMAEQIKGAQSIMHESMHAISYRRIERYDEEGRDCSVYSGICHTTVTNGRQRKEKDGLNESMTNYFALKALPNVAENPDEERAILRHREKRGDWIVVGALAKIVGENVLREAYFEGNVERLRQALNKKGIDAEAYFQACEGKNGDLLLEMLSRAKRRKK